MAPFLSKVWFRPRKKHDKDDPDVSKRHSDPSLLEGKFERVSPNVSPTAANFSNQTNGNGKEKEAKREKGGKSKEPFSLLRIRSSSPVQSPSESPVKNQDYHLSLNLAGPKTESRSRPLGVVFEGETDAEGFLTAAAIGRRRLSPQETLVLIRACSQAIMAKGLTSLGIMHPHWYSASPETQRRLLSIFIQSLASNSPSNTLPTDNSSSSSFESHITSTHSAHDVAAVLRWGVRHLQLEGSTFGRAGGWYQTFLDAERNASYPPKAFSETLVPLVPQSHVDLLNATLTVLSALAANAEANGISGSKLSMLFGLCLLTSQRSEAGEDWPTFYDRWERHGRMLEHLFLSSLRDEAASQPLPKRLAELVQHYPYSSSPSADAALLPRPRFSTLRHDALFIHIDSDLPSSGVPTKSLIKLVEAALRADFVAENTETKSYWETLRDTTSSEEDTVDINKILSDETIQLFNLFEPTTTSPTFKLDIPNGFSRRRSLSLNGDNKQASAASKRREQSASVGDTSLAPAAASNMLGIDWSQFSNSGFLESEILKAPLAETLLDKDLEVTHPPSSTPPGRKTPSRKSSERRGATGRGRKSLETLPPITIPDSSAMARQEETQEEAPFASRVTQSSFVKLDEAFIDFWADSLLDPISESWPRFAICRLTSLPGLEIEVPGKKAKQLEWLVVDQKFIKPGSVTGTGTERTPASAIEPDSATTESAARPRATSPKPSLKSFSSSAKKRFTFWSASEKDKDDGEKDKGKSKKKKGSPKIGEMGEILEDESTPKEKAAVEAKPEKEAPTKEKEGVKGSDILAGAGVLATGAVAAGAATGVASGIVEDADKKDAHTLPTEDGTQEPIPTAEATGESKEEGQAKDEGVTEVEEKLPVSESALAAGVMAATSEAGLTDAVVEKKDEQPAAPDAQAVAPAEEASHQSEETAAPAEPESTKADDDVARNDPAQEDAPTSVQATNTLVAEPEPPVQTEAPSEQAPVVVEEVEEEAKELELAAVPIEEATEAVEPPTEAESSQPQEVTHTKEDTAVGNVALEEPPVEEAPLVSEPPTEIAGEVDQTPAQEDVQEAVGSDEDIVVQHAVGESPAEEAPFVSTSPSNDEKVNSTATQNESDIASEQKEEAPIVPVETVEPVESEENPAAAEDVEAEAEANTIEAKDFAQQPTDGVAKESVDKTEPEAIPVHTEPLNDTSAEEDKVVDLPSVPVVEAEPIPPVEPTPLPDPASEESITPPVNSVSIADDSLPPAPVSVVSAGDTPGPELALSSSEPAAQQLSETDEVEVTKDADSITDTKSKHAEESEHVAPTHTQEPQDA